MTAVQNPVYLNNDVTPKPQLLDVFDAFGQKRCNMYVVNKTTMLNKLNLIENKKDFLKKNCVDILKGNWQQVNVLLIDNVVSSLLSESVDNFNNMLIDIFNSHTNDIQLWLQSSLTDGSFDPVDFVEKYNKYGKNSMTLRKILWIYDKNVSQADDKGKSYSFLNLIKNYLFYTNVINKKYQYQDSALYLYDILSEYIDFDGQNQITDIIVPMFNMFQFYNKLSHIPKNREQLFNLELENKFFVNMGTNQEFIKNFVTYIHDSIKRLSVRPDVDNVSNSPDPLNKSGNTSMDTVDPNQKEILQLMDVVKMAHAFKEKELLLIHYDSLLANRLLNSQSDLKLEGDLLKLFNIKDDVRVICKMKYKIEDMLESRLNEKYFSRVQINTKSEKYAGLDIKSLRREMCKFDVLRFYAWELSESDQYNVPINIAPYVDIYRGYYEHANPDRKLTFNFDNSISVVKMEFGANVYHVQMALPQLFVITHLLNLKKVSIEKLFELVGGSLEKVLFILNGLERAKLVTKNDDTKEYSLNPYFQPPAGKTKIAIASLMKIKPAANNNLPLDPNLAKLKDVPFVLDPVTIDVRQKIVMANIINILKKSNKQFTSAELSQEILKNKIPFDIGGTMFKDSLQRAVVEKYVASKNDIYSYFELDKDKNKKVSDSSDSSDSDDSDSESGVHVIKKKISDDDISDDENNSDSEIEDQLD
jgi:hypothetical protein